ncbi:MAG TPA: hypothetical protein VJU82_14520 [Acidobacteriaceae bacterium]|nr:hypothetical protein [Acidobacteriaceae bacterium]
MGQVRSWDYDAVIGVGGIGSESSSNQLARKVNWIGIGAHKRLVSNARGPIVTFDHFLLYEETGPILQALAPTLAGRLYGRNVRALLHDISEQEMRETERILGLAVGAPRSQAMDANATHVATCPVESKCGSRKCFPRRTKRGKAKRF